MEYAHYGLMHYPLHGQEHSYPGVSKLAIHPPAFYFLAGNFLKIFGISPLVASAFVSLVITVLILLMTVLLSRAEKIILFALVAFFIPTVPRLVVFRPELFGAIIAGLTLIFLVYMLQKFTNHNRP